MKFQPIQNFDGLSPQTTKGDLIARSTTQAVRVAVGSDGQVVTADSTQASGIKWATPSGVPNVITKTSAYPAAAGDFVLASSASFAVTLPTAVGISGQGVRIKKTDASLSNVISIATTSAQTIDGVSATLYACNTQNEEWSFVSDGSNWVTDDHSTVSPPASWTPMFSTKFTVTSANATAGAVYTNNAQTFVVVQTLVAGTTLQMVGTGNPAASGTLSKTSGVGDASITFSTFANAFGTVTTVSAWWQRLGNRMKGWGSFFPGTATANLAVMSLPLSVSLDTSVLAPSNNVITNAGMKVGTMQGSGGASALYNLVTAPGTNTSMLFNGNVTSGTATLTPQSAQTGITSGALISWDFDIAISGWLP